MTRSLQRTFFLGQMEQQDKRTSANEEKDRKRDRWNVEHERILLFVFFFFSFTLWATVRDAIEQWLRDLRVSSMEHMVEDL